MDVDVDRAWCESGSVRHDVQMLHRGVPSKHPPLSIRRKVICSRRWDARHRDTESVRSFPSSHAWNPTSCVSTIALVYRIIAARPLASCGRASQTRHGCTSSIFRVDGQQCREFPAVPCHCQGATQGSGAPSNSALRHGAIHQQHAAFTMGAISPPRGMSAAPVCDEWLVQCTLRPNTQVVDRRPDCRDGGVEQNKTEDQHRRGLQLACPPAAISNLFSFAATCCQRVSGGFIVRLAR